MSGLVDRYLDELRRMLPRFGRERVLAEAEDHLREAAARTSEEEAVARFGPAEGFAREVAPIRAAAWGKLAAFTALGAVLAFPLAYPVYENNLPPAPWPTAADLPAHLEWKRDAVYVLALASAAAAIASLLRVRAALALVAVAPAALGAMCVALTVEWAQAVPGTPRWLVAVALGQLALCLVPSALSVRAALLARAR